MQQATGAAGLDTTANGNSLPSESERYVINLSASTTPVGLTAPTHAQLRHYTFFVSRKLENGRERFRLHMGYFNSLDEAEHMLELVREIYPAAWAGAAPGQRLHTRVIAAGKLGGKPGARGAAAPATAAATAGVAAPASTPAVATPAAATPVVATPVVAAPAAAVATVAARPPRQQHVPPVATVVACVVPAHADIVAPQATTPPVNPAAAAASESFQQIRATIDALGAPASGTLDRTGNTVIAPGITALRAAEASSGARALSSQQALALLEQPPREYVPAAATTAAASGAAPKAAAPDAAAAQRARPVRAQQQLASPVPSAPPAAPFYAVQLLWAVQPIDMGRVPQLAIFSAYRLYGAEGNREGRRWYGLRLGFFADSVSAQQVANYVRSEFTSVSVVPVSAGERERATRSTAQPLPAAKSEERNHGMQFIDEVPTDTATSGSRPALDESAVAKAVDAEAAWAAAASAAVQGGPAVRKGTAPGKRAKLRVGTRPASKHPQRSPPATLEQTLDALGASTLSLDEGRGERMQFESTAGRASAPAPAANRFGKLLDRLTKRFGSV